MELLLPACSLRKAAPTDGGDAPPAATGSAAPAPPKRRETKEPSSKDPSAKPPAGYRRMAVGGIAPTTEGNAVVLMDESARRGLVLHAPGTAARAIALRLEHKHAERPPTHDLLDTVVQQRGGDILSVRVDRVENEVFYGSVLMAMDGRLVELDAHPGDALALAIGNAVPVFVSEAVLAQAGIDIDRFDFRKLREPPDRAAKRNEVAL